MAKRIALVLGGTSGVGLATARQLRDRGAEVHIAGRDKRRVDAAVESVEGLSGHQADATDAAALTELLEAIGKVDWLVVTLSGAEGMGPLAELDLAVLRRAFDAKFWAHLTAIKAALPHLADDGSITLVSAITARTGMPGTAGLSALNSAIEGLVRPLAVELAPIRVNAVSPGFVDTPWWSGMPDDARQEYFTAAAAKLPTGQIASAEQVAEVVTLAATNPNITGTVLETDGGSKLVSMA